MACYNPLLGWRSKVVNSSGKRSIVFNKAHGYEDLQVEVPCGQCIGCRLERSRQWAIRCLHESQLYDSNCFITLTYSDDNLPGDESLVKSDFQKFMKRLRKNNPRVKGNGIRYFMCGEYGEKCKICGKNKRDCWRSNCTWTPTLGRPHYHACLFNFDFSDKLFFKLIEGNKYYESPELQSLWPYGYSLISDVTFDSACYTARYITKKVTGDMAEEHYNGLEPEYCTMSRRPGLGTEWFKKYKQDFTSIDRAIINGKEVNLPKFYRIMHELDEPKEAFVSKCKRKLAASNSKDNSTRRLRDRETCTKARLNSKPRSMEKEF
jgi:hypothetical protein